jgi:hypothetical protein
MRRKMLRCPCGAKHSIPEGAVRIECPKCGRVFGQPKPAPNQTREMERRLRQAARKSNETP